MGSICIAKWVELANTCPYCRKEFFPRDKLSDADDDDLEPGEISEGRIEYGDDYQDAASADRFLEWYRSVLTLARETDEMRESEWTTWLEDYHNATLTLERPNRSDLGLAIDCMSRLWGFDRDEHGWLLRVAAARRTREFREVILYLQLRDPYEVQIVAPVAQSRLNGRQEEWLLRRLIQEGAFDAMPSPLCTVGWGREDFRRRWEIIREAGYVYDMYKTSQPGELLGGWSLAPY